jgi:hypothetical protein
LAAFAITLFPHGQSGVLYLAAYVAITQQRDDCIDSRFLLNGALGAERYVFAEMVYSEHERAAVLGSAQLTHVFRRAVLFIAAEGAPCRLTIYLLAKAEPVIAQKAMSSVVVVL